MIEIENIETMGWSAAIRGMRNPMNSWDKSDSLFLSLDGNYYTIDGDCGSVPPADAEIEFEDSVYIGPNDYNLIMKLCKAGSDHRKFMRMIVVYMDITAPLYWWKEFDTYKVGTVANSCSTMHKIAAKEFTLDDFSRDHLYEDNEFKEMYFSANVCSKELTATDALKIIIDALNHYREQYLVTKDKSDWWQMIQLLPSSYNQKRTVMLNYEVLANIYTARKDHKLNEWRTFCDMCCSLPISELITGGDEK